MNPALRPSPLFLPCSLFIQRRIFSLTGVNNIITCFYPTVHSF